MRAGLADRLRRNDSNRRADINHITRAQIAAIAQGADPMNQVAGQRTANFNLLQRRLLDGFGNFFVDKLIAPDNQLAGIRVMQIR